MGTSNWQNIPFCVDALMKISPRRVLDVGVGFGRWGMIVREFCDVRRGRVLHSQWSVHIEGIEIFKKNISDYHYAFYNKIYFGDAREIIPSLNETWDVVIFGDVLEHFERNIGESLLDWCLEHAAYVLINIPLGDEWSQSELYKNADEKHLSTWYEEDFDAWGLCRKALFVDYIGSQFGSFVLSHDDPRNLHTLLSLELSSKESPQSEAAQIATDLYTQALQTRNDQLIAELHFIKNSRSYRLIERLKAMPFSGIMVRLGKLLISDGFPSSDKRVAIDIGQSTSPTNYSDLRDHETMSQAQLQSQASRYPREKSDQDWVEQQLRLSKPLSINHPEWRGILASTTELFGNIYTIPDNLDEEKAFAYAELFRDAAIPSITIQGFPISYFLLVKAIRKIAPEIPIFAIWHGNMLYTRDDYDWNSFKLLISLCEEGDIAKIGFVKKGMAEVMSAAGINAYFLMNFVRRVPEAPSQPMRGGRHIGIWAEPDWGWKKLPYAMMASLPLIPDCVGHVHNVSPRANEFGNWLKLNAEYQIDLLPHARVMEKMAKMHLNLYVSLTECAPMLPLESLSVGSPCLLGPTSHYFLDHDFLYKRLVVPYPDNPEAIARSAIQTLEERDEIINAYRAYAPDYNRCALMVLENFLEYPLLET